MIIITTELLVASTISILFTIIFILGFKFKYLHCPSKGWFHHFYLGSILFLLLPFVNETWLIISISFISVYLWLDDFSQHIIQKYNPNYHSLLHKFYVKYIWKHLNNLFKKWNWFYVNVWSKF